MAGTPGPGPGPGPGPDPAAPLMPHDKNLSWKFYCAEGCCVGLVILNFALLGTWDDRITSSCRSKAKSQCDPSYPDHDFCVAAKTNECVTTKSHSEPNAELAFGILSTLAGVAAGAGAAMSKNARNFAGRFFWHDPVVRVIDFGGPAPRPRYAPDTA